MSTHGLMFKVAVPIFMFVVYEKISVLLQQTFGRGSLPPFLFLTVGFFVIVAYLLALLRLLPQNPQTPTADEASAKRI